ncbi:hypothetical protein AAFF_G00388670 [Aldrovandia affinis]|uniref:Uncharacterized protein n=1 Tax=Aldrovandia affinis TaxID=143900 RepID=A0AAD7VYX3_9TELE|nr:hypothetical protein AAFF_G00388670 [Aldrovandia affinis]
MYSTQGHDVGILSSRHCAVPTPDLTPAGAPEWGALPTPVPRPSALGPPLHADATLPLPPACLHLRSPGLHYGSGPAHCTANVLFKLRNCKFQRRLHATWDQVSKATKEPAGLQTGCVGGCPPCEASLTDEGALCTR